MPIYQDDHLTARFVGRLRLSRWKPPPLGGGGSRARTVWGGF